MLMRIFNQHSSVHAINETHFMERHWKRLEEDRFVSQAEAMELLLEMISKQRDGFFANTNEQYREECKRIFAKLGPFDFTKVEILKRFMTHEAKQAGKSIVCEKTPQHVFYITELLRLFPNAKVINIVRDPRSVLASQKNKWKRRKLGSSFMPKKESIRLRINYHPITMSQLWNAAVGAGEAMSDQRNVTSIRYEDLLKNPTEILEQLCQFVDISFEPSMLQIAATSSSLRADDSKSYGIHTRSIDSWRGQLSAHEVSIVQQRCSERMKRWGYDLVDVPAAPFNQIISYSTYPFKILLALAINRSRLRNMVDAIGRRMVHAITLKMKTT